MIAAAKPALCTASLVQLEPMSCVFLELDNPRDVGLDFDAAEVATFLANVKSRCAATVDWNRGIIFQLDGLSSILRGEFASVRQTVCLPLKESSTLPAELEACRFRSVRVLRTPIAGDLTAAVTNGLSETRSFLEARREFRLGAFARIVVSANDRRTLDVEIV